MRSGPIKIEPAELRFDQRDQAHSLWEQGTAAAVDLPWASASSLEPAEVRRRVASARSVSLVVGDTPVSRTLLKAVIEGVPKGCRIYVYADSVLEADVAFGHQLATVSDRVIVRTGHRPPADWFVIDHGQDGLLILGSSAATRRWIIPVDGSLSRSLFEAFRVLFWFNAVREAIPDTKGKATFRTPLAAPFSSPGSDVTLASGRLRMGANLIDPVPDAELRYSPTPVDPGPARILFMPPQSQAGGRAQPTISLAAELTQRGQQVVWSNLELPRTTVTRQRLILDLVEPPIALQLEWPRAVAIDILHRLERVARAPEWVFHAARRLGEVCGPVLLDGATQAASIDPSISLKAEDVSAALLTFDTAQPSRLPDIPTLALEVIVQWRRVPAAVPSGARQAEIVRQWTSVDEWAARRVELLRGVLDELDHQEGMLEKLLRWLPSRSPLVRERRQLRDELDELGESKLSETFDQARNILDRLAQIGERLMTLRRSHHDEHQAGLDADAKEAQQAAWRARIDAATASLVEARAKLATNEDAQRLARNAEQVAQAAFDDAVVNLREERRASLDSERARLAEALADVKSEHQRRADAHEGKPPKAERKEWQRRIAEAEKVLAKNQRELASVASWEPSASELGDASIQLKEARDGLQELRAEANKLLAELKRLERQAAEEFKFVHPARLPVPPTIDLNPPPSVPNEAPPELGELFEHKGKRFLAIRTWEQVKKAEPVARRLRAEIVASTLSK